MAEVIPPTWAAPVSPSGDLRRKWRRYGGRDFLFPSPANSPNIEFRLPSKSSSDNDPQLYGANLWDSSVREASVTKVHRMLPPLPHGGCTCRHRVQCGHDLRTILEWASES